MRRPATALAAILALAGAAHAGPFDVVTPMAPRLGSGGIPESPDAPPPRPEQRNRPAPRQGEEGGGSYEEVRTVPFVPRERREILDGVSLSGGQAYMLVTPPGLGTDYMAVTKVGAGACRIRTRPVGGGAAWTEAQLRGSGRQALAGVMPGVEGVPARLGKRLAMRYQPPGRDRVAFFTATPRTQVDVACDGLGEGDLARATSLAAGLSIP